MVKSHFFRAPSARIRTWVQCRRHRRKVRIHCDNIILGCSGIDEIIYGDSIFQWLHRGELIFLEKSISGAFNHPFGYYPIHIPILYAWAYFFDFEEDPKTLTIYLRSILSISLITTTALLSISYFIGDTIFAVFFSNDKLSFFPLGFIAVASTAIAQTTLSYFVYLQNKKWLREFVTLRLIDIFIAVVLQV